MSECKYRNHKGVFFDFLAKPYLVSYLNPFYSYSWQISENSGRVAGYNKKGIYQQQFELNIVGKTKEDAVDKAEAIFAEFENDIAAGKRSRIYVNGYYLECNIIARELINKVGKIHNYMLTLATDKMQWVKEIQTITFEAKSLILNSEGFRESTIPLQLPFGFPDPNENREFDNPATIPCRFRLKIFGACENPAIVIAGQTYAVNITLENSETLTIDSRAGTIQKQSGSVTINCFSSRDTESDIFAKIPPGRCMVSWNSFSKCQLTLIEERSAPPCA